MRSPVLTRLVRLLTMFAFVLGMQAAVFPLMAATDKGAGSMPVRCDDCSKGAMPTAQCAAVCIFVLLPSNEPVSTIAPAASKLRPALAAIPTGWSTPPETAPPRL